ncbi:MAG: hypothetical protein PHX24_14435 [Acidithiobacillus sp.]|nr:hypothetical protein [Acidithiobacillus sp.]
MKNANPKWNLKEYTSEFILDGSNQFVFTFPILMIPIYWAFIGNFQLLLVYFGLLTMFFFAFYGLSIARLKLRATQNKSTPWAFRPLPQKNENKRPRFLKEYGFGSTSVFLTVVVFFVYAFTPYLGEGPQITRGFWVAFILIVGWDLVIYLFSIAAGMEKHHTAWMRDFLTKDMNGAEYKQFLRNEYLAEKGRAAGFNEGYMVGRNSRH